MQHAIEGGGRNSFGDRSLARSLTVGENGGAIVTVGHRDVNSLFGLPVGAGETVVAEEGALRGADEDFRRRPVNDRGQFAVRF